MEKRIELEKHGKSPAEVKELILDNCHSSSIVGLTDDFVNLEILSLISVGLTSLKGFPKLPNLRRLELSNNRISGGLNLLSVSPRLSHLNLSGNKIEDISTLEPLKEFKNLKVLGLFGCDVTSVENYRQAVFDLLSSLIYLDGSDINGKEIDDSGDRVNDDNEENGSYEDDESDFEDEEGVKTEQVVRMEPVEYRAVIKFLFLKGNTPQQIFREMTTVYGSDAPSYDVIKHWHRQFRSGRTSVETAPIPGRPQSATDGDSVTKVEAAILEDRRITIQELAQRVKISVGSVEKIIREHLQVRKVSACWVPRFLSPFQKEDRVICSRELLAMCHQNQEDFFARLITQDEMWVHRYDPGTKTRGKQWKHYDSPTPKKARVQPSVGKVMLTVFWDQQGVVMTDFLPEGATMTGAYYASILVKLQEAIKEHRHGMLSKGVLLLQDSTPAHNSRLAQMEARSCGYEILCHPQYSPDLVPSDFHLYPPMKLFLKGKHFPDDDMLITEVKSWLQTKPEDFYKRGIHNCIKRWQKCVALGGSYVEKD